MVATAIVPLHLLRGGHIALGIWYATNYSRLSGLRKRDVSMSHDVQKIRSFDHPGEGRRRAKPTPKGRQVDPQAAEEIALLLGDRPRRRDLLIEHLHLVQDTYGQISAAHLAALADQMELAF